MLVLYIFILIFKGRCFGKFVFKIENIISLYLFRYINCICSLVI